MDIFSQELEEGRALQESPSEFGREEEDEEEGSISDISSLPALTQVATASPRMIVSPKMQNIHLIMQDGDEDDEQVAAGEQNEGWSPGLGLNLHTGSSSSDEGDTANEYKPKLIRRQSILWAENQAQEDAAAQERVRAEAETLVRSEGDRVKAEAQAEIKRLSRGKSLSGDPGSEEGTVVDVQSIREQEDANKKKAERERRLRAEEERLLCEEDARREATRTKLEKEEIGKKRTTEKTASELEIKQDQEAQEIAVEIVQGIYNKVDYTQYANFLGAKENCRVLEKFMLLMEPIPNSLVLSLYKLVTRIYFVAEAQAIDSILEKLSIRWTHANPTTHWGSRYDLCHIVLFSLLILNSDLHNAENNQPRFSREQFVENTLFAVSKESAKSNFDLVKYELDIREELGNYYDALKSMALPLLKKDESKKNSRNSRDSRDGKFRISRRTSKTSTKSQLANSTENSSDDEDGASIISSSSQSVKREPQYTSNWKFHNNKPLPRLYQLESVDEIYMHTNGTSWCMDSGIKINERDLLSFSSDRSAIQKTAHPRIPSGTAGGILRWITRPKPKSLLRGNRSPVAFFDGNTKWANVRCRVYEGRLYVFKNPRISMGPQSSVQELEHIKKASDVYFVCSLYESLATLVQENVVVNSSSSSNKPASNGGNSNQRGNFTVTIPPSLQRNKTLLEFQTSTVEEAQRFVQCINFWAARLTPVPAAQFEIVSNEENGWSPHVLSNNLSIESLENTSLTTWKPLLSIDHLYNEQGNSTEQTSMADKMEILKNFAECLQHATDSHNSVKLSMISIWQRTSNFDRAMDNWNKKYLYLNEINERTSVYLNALKAARMNA